MKNYIILEPIKNKKHCKNVILQLGDKQKLIGKIDFAGDGTFTTSRKESHLLRKLNALGLSYGLLSHDSLEFKWIIIDYCGRKLITSKEFFLRFGQVLHFNNYETQCFLPLNLFGINLVREYEKKMHKELNQQQNLFANEVA